jgi:hypothetical protein
MMRANLTVDGKLIEPRSEREGRNRLQQLGYELSKIQRQINDTSKVSKFRNVAEYSEWKLRACRARNILIKEQTLLEEWLQKFNTVADKQQHWNFWTSPFQDNR